MNPHLISVVIPNLNGERYLEACLQSVLAQEITPWELELVVVDNGSADRSVEIIEWFSDRRIRLIRNSVNVGFTPAINQGLEAAQGDWVLLLNNDTVMQPGALRALVDYLNAGPAELGGVQPLLLRASDPAVVDSAGIALEPRFRARDDLHGQPRTLVPAEPVEVWGLCAGCTLLKREIFSAAGQFDPDFFAEWDDVDFALRARWLGYRFALVPEAVVLHHRSPTSRRDPAAKIARHRRNQIWTMLKGLPAGMARRFILYRFVRDLSMIPHYLRAGELGAMVGVWREGLGRRRVMQERRRALMAQAKLSPAEMKRQIEQFIERGRRR